MASEDMFKPIGALAEEAEAAAPAGDDEGGGEGAVKTSTLNSGEMMSMRSLCVACEGTGTTNMLLTRIPFFRDIIVMAFQCEECGYRNSEVQAADVQEKGCHFELKVTSVEVRAGAGARGRGR
jgi:zinc finger protein